jgi:DNA-binding response OmpR family regulator
MIVILTQDLMMSSSVSTVARARNLEFRSATSTERVLKLAGENSISTVFVDLQHPNLDLVNFLSALMANSTSGTPKIIAYAQHVHVDLLTAARKAGIEEVYTRGQVHGNLESLVGS